MGRDFSGYLDDRDAPPVTVTARVLECLRYASHGLTREQTAEAMLLAPDTVMHHLATARLELSAKTTTHACCIALRLGLID
jgi:DNA-binding CsgD family transcriptional regulator